MVTVKTKITNQDIVLHNEANDYSWFNHHLLTREKLVEIINKAVNLGWTKTFKYNELFDIHLVVLKKEHLEIAIGKLKNGEWYIHCKR
jgi:hypothetical protein